MPRARTFFLIALLIAVPAGAADQLLPGKKLQMRNTSTGKQKLSVSAKSPIVIATNPTGTGATLEIRAASGEAATLSLPASNWEDRGGGVFKFKNKDAPAGPSAVKLAILKDGSVKISAKGTGITLDEPTQVRIGFVLNVGQTRYCLLFGGTIKRDEVGRFSAKDAPAPVSCPSPVVPTTTTLPNPPTTTTTSTSTTTTTLVSVLCGNSTIDANEQCDPPGSACGTTLCNADCTCPCDFIDTSICLYPFPNDYFTRVDPSTDTGLRVNLGLEETPRNSANKPIDPTDQNRADGFSPGSSILLKVPGVDLGMTGAPPITDIEQSLDSGSPIVLVNATTLAHHLFWAELDANAATDADRTLILRPGVNLEEGQRYIVALRNMKDGTGTLIPPTADFLAYRDATAFPPADTAKEARRTHFEDLFTTLAAAGVARGDLYLAWDFTVASERSLSERMLHIRDDAFTSLGLGVPPYVVTQIENEVDSRIYRRVTGTFLVPRYMSTTTTGSEFVYGLDGLPARQPGDQPASFICTIPRAALASAAAAAVPGRASLYGHGLLGSNSEVNAGNVKDMGNEHNFVFCATKWMGMSDDDLFNIGAILLDLSNFNRLADRNQQGFLNQLYLARLMLHPGGFASNLAFQDASGTPVIAPGAVFYDGNSQGGIMGGSLMAVAQDIKRGVLGVPGMNYSTLLTRSSDFGTYSFILYMSYTDELERPLLFALIQMLWDRGEANGYAHHMTSSPYPDTPPHEVLLHEAFGDFQVANVTTEVETRTIGASIYQPALMLGRHTDVNPFSLIPAIPSFPFNGSALVVWDAGTAAPPIQNIPPSTGSDPHSKPRSTPAARVQKSEFLKPAGAVVDVCSGAPCLAP